MGQIDLRDIVTEEFQMEIQDSFAYATGFGVVFVDPQGRHIGSGSNFCRFCAAINETPEGSRCCTLSNRNAIELALKTKKPSIYVCHAGLVNIEIPLIYDGCYVGAITAGQVRCAQEGHYPVDQVSSTVNWLERDQFAQYYQEIKILTCQQIEATTTALANITNHILQKVAYAKVQQDLAAQREKLLLYEKRQIELEHRLKQAQLDALQKQVTPHFIFNVISSISRLVSMGEYDTTISMLDALALMMRYNLSGAGSTVTLGQELEYIRNYLSIQKIRFGERINFDLECDPALETMRLPFFSLQPLVENSVEHGLLPMAQGGRVKLTCRRERDAAHITLRDSGTGIAPDMLCAIKNHLQSGQGLPRRHIGLLNCYKRLKLQYGEDVDFLVESVSGEGTCITIRIPL